MPTPPAGIPDLHRHLDGSLRADTLAELAAADGREVPTDLRFSPGMGLGAALARFQFILELLQDHEVLERVAREVCEDAESEGVSTLEIRFAPQLHGQSRAAAIDAVLHGADGRAGIILCGLYGESPSVLQELVRLAASRPGVVGIDLAGGPRAMDTWGMGDYVPAFRAAADAGLGRTVHAGEGRPAEEIECAIEKLLAGRIGHGTTLLDEPRVVDLAIRKRVTIEACPTSNVHTGVIRSVSDHPLAQWLRLGVSACVCPDNTFLSGVSASEELDLVARELELDDGQRQLLIDNGHRAAFARR